MERYVLLMHTYIVPFEAEETKKELLDELELLCWKAFKKIGWNGDFEFFSRKFYVYEFMNNHTNDDDEVEVVFYEQSILTLDEWFESNKWQD